VLVRNPHYGGDWHGAVDTIRVRLGVGGRRAALGLASGQLDLLWPSPDEFRERLQREPGVRRAVESGPSANYWALVLNTEIAPTARRLVRQAVARSVNRQRLLDLLGTRASPWRTFAPGLRESPSRGGTLAPGFDPIAALADLEAARATRGVPLTVTVPRGSREFAVARAILGDMGRGGVYAETRSVPRSQARRALVERRQAMATMLWCRPPTSDPLDNLAEEMLNRGLDEKWEGNTGFLRIGGGAALDSLLLRALRANGAEARMRGREEIEGRLAEELPYVPIARIREEAYYRADLDGVRFHPLYGLDLAGIRRLGRR
jgi:ABC-type transport system substrate-binding protein